MDIVFKKAVMNVLFSHRQQNQIANLTQKKIKKKNRMAFENVAKVICMHSLYLYVCINIYLATIHLTL